MIYWIDVRIPDKDDRIFLHRIIYDELCNGVINPDSRRRFLQIIQRLSDDGTEGIILGCTGIALLIRHTCTHIPLFITTEIHARNTAEFALSPA